MAATGTSSLVGGRYALLDKLGAGGMGVVYRALDRLTGQQVAMKLVATGDDQKPEQDADMRLALAQEFQILAALRHPNIISVLDYGFDAARRPYFTMDLLVASQSILAAGEGKPLAHKINLLAQTLQALVYLYRWGILHRDLKPGNVLVVDDQVKVLDFGLSISFGSTQESVGTPAYMAPEIIQGQPATSAADLYAIGVMAYELLADRHPFDTSRIGRLLNEVLNKPPDLNLLTEKLNAAQNIPLPPPPDTLPELDQTQVGKGHDKTTRPSPPNEPDKTTRVGLSNAQTRPHLPLELGDESALIDLPEWENPLVAIVAKLLAKSPHQRYTDPVVVIHDLSTALGEPLPIETAATRESFLQAAQFVGRDQELAQLAESLNQTIAGHGRAWLVGGESGVGKTRLMNELRTRALVAGALVLRGQAVSEAGLPYQIWREPLRRLALTTDLNDADAAALKTLVPDIGELLGRAIPDAPESDPDQRNKQLTAVIASILHHQQQPLVVLLEDLHWTSSESRAVLHQISQLADELPLLLVGTYRDDEAPDLPQTFPAMQVMKLERLRADAIAMLSESMLGRAGHEPQVLDLLQRETEGNVFFLVEVVRALAEEAGQLDQIAGMTLPAHVFTGGVQHIVQRRLSRVPADAYPLLQIAAVLGRQLDLPVLKAASPAADLDSWLLTCANAAVLEVYDEGWRFAHDKLRDGILNALTPDQSRALHRQAALAIEATIPDQVNALAYHWRMAADAAKEAHYAALAGDQADQISAYQEAADYFGRTLELLAQLPDLQPQRALLTARLGRVYARMNRHADALRVLQEALVLADAQADPCARAGGLATLGNVARAQGALQDAARYYADCLTVSRECGEQRTAAEALRGLARVAGAQGQYAEAAQRFGESLAISRAIGDQWGAAYALGDLALVASIQGMNAAASERLQESLTVFRTLGDRRGVASVLLNLGMVLLYQNQAAEAVQRFEESLAISREIGDRWSAAAALNNLGGLALAQQNYEQAARFLEDSLALFREIGDRGAIAQTLTNLGHVAFGLDDLPLATARYQEALQLAQAMGAVPLILEIMAGVARLRAKAQQVESALELVGLALAHPATNNDAKAVAEPLLTELRARLPADTVAQALERGKAGDLDAAVAAVLADLANQSGAVTSI